MARTPTGTKEAAAGGLLFVLYFVVGGSFVGTGLLPEGLIRQVAVVILAILMVAAFFWLLVSRLVRLFSGNGNYLLEALLAGTNILLLLAAFAGIYAQLGLTDTTGGKETMTHNYWEAAYYSVVTFTTLGYGDLVPHGACRVLAAMEAFVGYVVLALIASTAANFVQAAAKQRMEHHADNIPPAEA